MESSLSSIVLNAMEPVGLTVLNVKGKASTIDTDSSQSYRAELPSAQSAVGKEFWGNVKPVMGPDEWIYQLNLKAVPLVLQNYCS